jgi:hypothetical protein
MGAEVVTCFVIVAWLVGAMFGFMVGRAGRDPCDD